MRLHHQTPWARNQMPPELRERITEAEPREYLVSLGRGSYGWTCRILTPDLHLVGETFHAASMTSAFDDARRVMAGRTA